MRLTLKSAAVDPLKFSKYLNRLLIKQIQNAYLEVPVLHGILLFVLCVCVFVSMCVSVCVCVCL